MDGAEKTVAAQKVRLKRGSLLLQAVFGVHIFFPKVSSELQPLKT